jgi:hypothetical protein
VPSGLTPYQGSRRCYGYFRCDCGKSWESGYSWADKSQACKTCGDHVYPWRQAKLEQGLETSNNKRNRPHLTDLCGKCESLGFPCYNLGKGAGAGSSADSVVEFYYDWM